MKKKTILISLATFGLLLSGLIGCGNKPSEEPAPSSKPDETSQKSEDPAPSSVDPVPSSDAPQPSSSEEPPAPHEHVYAQVGEAEKNADDKDVKLYECSAKDSRYIGIAFSDFSERSDDFDSAANASKYAEVDASIWDDAVMLAKKSTATIGWKINVDQAIEGAKLQIGVTSTYASHGTSNMANQFGVKVNDDADFASWDVTGTYDDNGLAPTKRTYLTFKTINLKAGENIISIRQQSQSNRLLFGGEVKIVYTGDAKPVTPFPGYDVTFTVEHCKVLVFSTKAYDTEVPVETLTCKAKDETGAIVAYDPDDQLPQPQVSFKVVCDEGYSCTINNITVAPRENYKNLKQNPDSNEGQDDIFRITKVEGNLAVNIVPVAGEQAKGYKVQFVTTHCSVKVYIGPKNTDGTNLDTPEDGYYYARAKDGTYEISYTTPQINFEVVCDEGYEFVPVITDNKVDFITHPDTTKDGYNKFSDKGGYFNLTKIDDNLVITITATAIA